MKAQFPVQHDQSSRKSLYPLLIVFTFSYACLRAMFPINKNHVLHLIAVCLLYHKKKVKEWQGNYNAGQTHSGTNHNYFVAFRK